MTRYVALLRAVNVAGTGKLPMARLRTLAEGIGLKNVRTYIASGNLLFESDLSETEVKAELEAEIAAYAGKAVPVFVRTAKQLAAVHAADPFPDAHRSRHLVYFLDSAPPSDTIETVRDLASERIALGTREVYIDYGDGIRFTRLKTIVTKIGTGRSINTVAKLAEMMTD